MRMLLTAAVVLGLGLGMGRAGAQTPQQNQANQANQQNQPNQPSTAPQGTMDGMDVNVGMGPQNGSEASRRMRMAASQNKLPASPLHISFGSNAAAWAPAQLATLPHISVTVHNPKSKTDETYSGVLLIDLLTRLGVPASPHGKAARLYIVGEGADGFLAVYSLAEINPAQHDGQVIVADSLNGKPLGNQGPFKMIVVGDKHPSRWVRNLAAVRVLAAH